MANPALVENIDYTIENGNYVFTRSYLEARGYCCGNGCRNCPYGSAQVRVVSMVPSWTETLLACGARVVGRTRFCIHPAQGISKIPAVGGTKDWKLDLLRAQKPDFILLDQEENPLAMAENSPAEYLATHIQTIDDLEAALSKMAERFRSGGDLHVADRLSEIAQRWARVAAAPSQAATQGDWPGIIEWIKKPAAESPVVYIIWQKPWMAASRQTFIGSVLAKLGYTQFAIPSERKYPEFTLDEVPENALLLFSSEPFPFAREMAKLRELGRPAALVDGESFSWFGLRSLRFLEAALGL